MDKEIREAIERTAGPYDESLKRVRVPELYVWLFVYFEPEKDHHNHISVWGLPLSAVKKEFSSEQEFEDFTWGWGNKYMDLSAKKRIGDTYCHGFNIWSCDCGGHEGQYSLEAGWCRKARHLVRVDLEHVEHPEGKYGNEKVLMLVLRAHGAVFEVYDKPDNIGMVIIKPVPVPLEPKGS